MMYSDGRWMDKNHPKQNLPGKTTLSKTPCKDIGMYTYCWNVLLKIGGSEMCDVL